MSILDSTELYSQQESDDTYSSDEWPKPSFREQLLAESWKEGNHWYLLVENQGKGMCYEK
jgi:hypothetical protein